MNNISSERILSNVLPDGTTLSIEFERTADRFRHVLSIVEPENPEHSCSILRSVEGNAQQQWPASPPLQELLIETRPTGPVALLLGMAGTSHWSISVERSIEQTGFQFDCACRIVDPADFLGCCYNLLTYNKKESANVEASEFLRSGYGLSATVTPHYSISISQADIQKNSAVDAIQFSGDDGLWRIACQATETELPATIRWAYSIVLDQLPE